jgi:Uma2 family endonuclease
MSANVDLAAHFRAMEALVEAEPEGVNIEIARGVFMMSPRPRFRHTVVHMNLGATLIRAFGGAGGEKSPDWVFASEPEIRSETAFSRLIPDLAGWRRSAGGWPNPDENPIALVPEWVGEILSPSTESYDRGDKKDAYGLMGVGWRWLVDSEGRRLETFTNIRGKMVAGPTFEGKSIASAPPFESLAFSLPDLFIGT